MYHNMKWVLTYLSEKGKIWKVFFEFAKFKQNCNIQNVAIWVRMTLSAK